MLRFSTLREKKHLNGTIYFKDKSHTLIKSFLTHALRKFTEIKKKHRKSQKRRTRCGSESGRKSESLPLSSQVLWLKQIVN